MNNMSKEEKIQTEFNKDDHVFGYQVLLDLYDCKVGTCDDLELCYDFLDKIVDYLGMNKMAPPQVMHGDAKMYPEKGPGVSGWVPLIESSVVIHTLATKNFISIDVYSCKYFDAKKALDFSKKYFEPKLTQYQTAERGINYYSIETEHHSMKNYNGEVELTKK
jgi:S-adenosylmethionine decarboxylase